MKIWEAREVLRPDRPCRNSVADRPDAPTMPISTRIERKSHGATGDAPIAVRPGEEIVQIHTGGGYRANEAGQKLEWERGEELWCTTIHYVGRQRTHSVQVQEEHAEAAPVSWAGLWGGSISQDARPRVVVDAPNVARYFQGQRDAPTSQTVLQNSLDELFQQVPAASQLSAGVLMCDRVGFLGLQSPLWQQKKH